MWSPPRIRLAPEHVVVVLGHQRDRVAEYLADDFPSGRHHRAGSSRTAPDTPCGSPWSNSPDKGSELTAGRRGGGVRRLPAAVPATLELLLPSTTAAAAAVTVLSAVLSDADRLRPDRARRRRAGGRNRGAQGRRRGRPAIHEVNSGMYVFDRGFLADGVGTDHRQRPGRGVPDRPRRYRPRCRARGGRGGRPPTPTTPWGSTTRAQLAELEAIMRQRINLRWMAAGVTMRDPATTYIDVGGRPGTGLCPGTRHDPARRHLHGCREPWSDPTRRSSTPGRCRVQWSTGSTANSADIGAGATVGPFTFLRPAAELAEGAKAGAFVEIKNAVVGPGAKVPHLTYVGDADIGAGANIGASSVFVNYDGVAKHRTVVGREARVGSDTMLVAPVVVGDGAYTAAGSVITEDVPPGALAIARGRQRNIEGWVEANRGGSTSQSAAAAAADAEARRHEHTEHPRRGLTHPRTKRLLLDRRALPPGVGRRSRRGDWTSR